MDITFTKLRGLPTSEMLPVQCEVNNIHDDFAVAVLKNSNTVGHVPREISRVCFSKSHKTYKRFTDYRGDGAGPAGTAAAGPMLEANLMNLIKGRLQKF